MENGFTLQESLNLLENTKNREVFQGIRKRLEDGKDLSESFLVVCPKKYQLYFEGFSLYLPFLEALTLSMRTVSSDSQQRKEYEKGLLYPCGLFLLTVCGAFLFNEFCFPSLVNMMRGFNLSLDGYEVFHIGTRIVCGGVAILLLLAGILLICFSRPSMKLKGFRFSQRWLPNSMWIQFESMVFIRFYLECIKMDIHTKESIAIMKSIAHKPILSFLAEQMDQSLTDGNAFEAAVENPYLDSTLTRFMKIAVYGSNMESMLKGYLTMSAQRMQRQCKKITLVIQLASYTAIGAVLILVYQLLLMPLTIMAQL